MRQYETIVCDVQDGVAQLGFNRPDMLNAMNRLMMDEIIDALEFITGDKQVSVAVITGSGRAFMAGADIKEYSRQTPDEFRSFQGKGRRLYALIEGAEIPFIAAVNGFALGGGFEIALACDFIVAAASAKMGLPEVHLGLIPGGGGAQRLLLRIGLGRAKEMLLLGQAYEAAKMLEWGVVHAVAEDGSLEEMTNALAEKLKRRPRQAVKAIKGMLTPSAIEAAFESRLDREGAAVAALFHTAEARKLIQEFVEKNK
ncbi:enoyl-CoA hydratase/isomerase family protein [Flavitalea sp. BT771]|uniref:enoyl-CoA hydratase/isomerase family protein n=1 Tax=Flavitalea sp. BT771 TaxID=3063329 RepID=UPI0026E3E11A|nr:enoyl-CoA hydratase/isomerase family protein [Flavitalea sp. BT771]MDO6432205.1 enoyl-CoA hydratase/isomerase family protein [Flavitalea sp. BT771]MDV6221115.1 enoyl-CoA hydratase/isomerase family protein [Flavitalea sp. BT771]